MLNRLNIKFLAFLAAIAAFCLPLSSCDKQIFEDEGDCDVTYRLRFKYDMNMKFADAFPHEVKSVRVYVYNEEGLFIRRLSDKGAHLGEEGYSMPLDMLEPGKYHLIVWGGVDNDGLRQESFTVNEPEPLNARKEGLYCKMNRKIFNDYHYVEEELYSLFHGTLDIEIEDENDPATVPGDYVFTVPLMKDTNHVRVILQHLSGKDVDVNDFSFRIEDANGFMAHDNSLLNDHTVNYHEWAKHNGMAGVVLVESNWQDAENNPKKVQVAIADLTVARLMDENPTFLTIRNVKENDRIVARIPLRDYALMVKDNYGEKMSNQEYLDRQDEYNLTFFLDEKNEWTGVSIIINSWRVVLHNQGI